MLHIGEKKKKNQFLRQYHFVLSRLLKLPSCLLVILIALPVDMLLITTVALWKSPYMLFQGWKRLLEDLIGRDGPFLETVCVPFAGLAIILWPLAVVGAVICAIICSFFLGLFSGVIVHQVCYKLPFQSFHCVWVRIPTGIGMLMGSPSIGLEFYLN